MPRHSQGYPVSCIQFPVVLLHFLEYFNPNEPQNDGEVKVKPFSIQCKTRTVLSLLKVSCSPHCGWAVIAFAFQTHIQKDRNFRAVWDTRQSTLRSAVIYIAQTPVSFFRENSSSQLMLNMSTVDFVNIHTYNHVTFSESGFFSSLFLHPYPVEVYFSTPIQWWGCDGIPSVGEISPLSICVVGKNPDRLVSIFV